jgi:hypothetical protein
MNGLSMNGLSMNGLSMNGLSMNGLALSNGLSLQNGLMTTDGGRAIVKYMAKCALGPGKNLIKNVNGVNYTFPGAIGIAPEAEFGPCGIDCQEKISACMLAHVNNSGAHIGIWLVGPDSAVGWGYSPDFPYQEGAFFGNLIQNPWKGHFCVGKDMGSGEVPGRLGAPIASNVYTNPYGGSVRCGAGCATTNEGYTSCGDWQTPGHTWTHPVTVWRNFETTQGYRICTKSGDKCLGVASTTSNVDQYGYFGSNFQKWKVLQVSPGKYKIVNVGSGKALTVVGTAAGTPVSQATYSGSTNQQFPIVYFTDQPGYATLRPANGAADWMGLTGGNANDLSLIKLDATNSADYAKWYFTAIGTVP